MKCCEYGPKISKFGELKDLRWFVSQNWGDIFFQITKLRIAQSKISSNIKKLTTHIFFGKFSPISLPIPGTGHALNFVIMTTFPQATKLTTGWQDWIYFREKKYFFLIKKKIFFLIL